MSASGAEVPKQPAFYHASPWRLRPGTHLRPRWSGFAFEYRVWLSSSLRLSHAIARTILAEHREGATGYAGTGWDLRQLPGEMHGVWIYRVKPTGPVERGWRAEWVTSFPVRVLEVAASIGQPELNQLPPPPLRTDEAMVGDALDPSLAPQVLAAFDSSDCGEAFRRALWQGLRLSLEPAAAAGLYAALARAPEDRRSEVVLGFRNTQLTLGVPRWAAERRRQHCKLTPDRRYRRGSPGSGVTMDDT